MDLTQCPACSRYAPVVRLRNDGCSCGWNRKQVPPAGDERARAAALADHLAASVKGSIEATSDPAMAWCMERFAGECALLAEAIRQGWDKERFERELVALPVPGN